VRDTPPFRKVRERMGHPMTHPNFVISTEAFAHLRRRSGETSVLCGWQRNTEVSPLRRKQRASGRDDKVLADTQADSSEPSSARGFWGRISGKRMTSRMVREPVRIMVRRSMPMPSPAVGGRP
jgi:hypothetical protein